MRKRLTSTRLLKLGSIATGGMLFQTAGCAPEAQALVETFATSFLNLLISSFVSNLFGVGYGF